MPQGAAQLPKPTRKQCSEKGSEGARYRRSREKRSKATHPPNHPSKLHNAPQKTIKKPKNATKKYNVVGVFLSFRTENSTFGVHNAKLVTFSLNRLRSPSS